MKPTITDNLAKVCVGAAGSCFIGITQLATRNTLECSQVIAIWCFALTMPIFVSAAFVPVFRKPKEGSTLGTIIDRFLGYTGILFLSGVASLLWSFGKIACALFTVSAIACFVATHFIPEDDTDSN